MQKFHEHLLAGHPGIQKLYNLILNNGYYWFDICKFKKKCLQCQLTKTDRNPIKPHKCNDRSSHANFFLLYKKLLFAPIGVNPALIQPWDIYQLLTNIKLPSNRRFPLNISDLHFSTFLSLYKLTTTIKFCTVIFIITIPILDTKDYDLYITHLLPI